jgi:hypothetical protein
MKIRKFLVSNFVLDYWITVFGKRFNAPRASRIIFPLMAIAGYVHVTNESILSWGLIGLVLASLYFGFLHFKFFPAKWEELDDVQKCQYGMVKSGKLTPEQFKEWTIIFEKLTK